VIFWVYTYMTLSGCQGFEYLGPLTACGTSLWAFRALQ